MSAAGIPERGLVIGELRERHEHGTRMRYLCGCKCFHCRRANSAYNKDRKQAIALGDWNGLVPADKARKHLTKMRRQGVGRRAVAVASDVADTVLQQINSGKKKRIRARTERLILLVTKECASDGAYISAGRTWWQIRQLLAQGYTKTRIVKEMGLKGNGLQLRRKRITVRNANRINRIWLNAMTVSGTEVEL